MSHQYVDVHMTLHGILPGEMEAGTVVRVQLEMQDVGGARVRDESFWIAVLSNGFFMLDDGTIKSGRYFVRKTRI